MFQLGGHAIFFDMHEAPLAKGKESISDTAKTASAYVNIIVARLFEHANIEELARNAGAPVINGLTNFSHPCQILSDLLTIRERFGKLKGLKLAYFGDANDNIVHSLLYACPKAGIDLVICCPDKKEFRPLVSVVDFATREARHNATKIVISSNAEITKGADIIYTDTWMSYHIPKSEEKRRIAALKRFQVNSKIMKLAKKDAIFMHCLPAKRGQEVSTEIIDGKQSIVWKQAENRLHMEKAILIWLLKRYK